MSTVGSGAVEHSYPWVKSYPPAIRWDASIQCFSLGNYLARSVARYRDRTAFIYRDSKISYNQFGVYVLSVAAAFTAMTEAETGIALYLPNTPFHPIAFFGAASAGRRIVQLSPLDAPTELAHKLHDSGARVLVTIALPELIEKALALKAEGLVDRLFVADDAYWGTASELTAISVDAEPFTALFDTVPLATPVAVDASEIALLQYTGGTTGLPKGAMLTHANLTAAAEMSAYLQSVRGRPEDNPDRVLLVLPLFHAFALTVLIRHIGQGNMLIIRQRFDPDQWLEDVSRLGVTSFNGVPTMWIALSNHTRLKDYDLSSLTLPTSGGAPLPVEVARTFERLTGLRIFPGWGMTEAAAIGTQHSPIGEIRDGSIGLPQPNFEVEIVDLEDPTRLLPPGETGEIRIRGPNVFKGYWNNANETRRAFVDGFFLTGDVGYIDIDGYVFLTDRKKDMILSSGFNVYPRVIEEAVYSHPGVAECIVVGVPDSYRGQSAKAFVSLKSGAQPFTLDELRAFLSGRLGKHEMPAALEIRDRLPKTNLGKLSKKMILEGEGAHAAATKPQE
ncbi:AMP-binding protein [Mesorhizobium sp. B4-1-4]|uniref:AMP-binding protein n=1 Tax=Mesorhizobium sp. B4-1-4 TaxID=2589888 RepID=UPI00112B1DB3|nr:AMP-binding protein [Mesorhizobium sp. B4-1-4]UCI31911.1 AMP-binding protein [Mesorhizobium sp. B4-1-4]